MSEKTLTDEERRQAFLKDLRDLTMLHDIAIGGCGCCGSPYLYRLGDDEKVGSYEATVPGDCVRWAPR